MQILWGGGKWNLFNISHFAVCKIKIEKIVSVIGGHCPHVFAVERRTGHTWHFHWNDKWIAHCLTELPSGQEFVQPHSEISQKLLEKEKVLRKSKGKEKGSSSTSDFIPPVPAPPPPPPKSAPSSAPVFAIPKPKPLVVQLPRKAGGVHVIPAAEKPLRLVIVSDTHNYIDRIPMPEGDILIHCGDFTVYGKDEEIDAFRQWLEAAPFTYKVVINGNHEVRPDASKKKLQDICHFLDNNLIHLCGIKIYGTSWKTDYDKIPADVDILYARPQSLELPISPVLKLFSFPSG